MNNRDIEVSCYTCKHFSEGYWNDYDYTRNKCKLQDDSEVYHCYEQCPYYKLSFWSWFKSFFKEKKNDLPPSNNIIKEKTND